MHLNTESSKPNLHRLQSLWPCAWFRVVNLPNSHFMAHSYLEIAVNIPYISLIVTCRATLHRCREKEPQTLLPSCKTHSNCHYVYLTVGDYTCLTNWLLQLCEQNVTLQQYNGSLLFRLLWSYLIYLGFRYSQNISHLSHESVTNFKIKMLVMVLYRGI